MMTNCFTTNTLSLTALSYRYNEQQALFMGITHQLTNGDMLLVTGQNGCGKSTLLRTLTGLIAPTSGTICWNLQRIEEIPIYHESLHYISHQNGLKSALTVIENIQLMLMLHLAKPTLPLDQILNLLSLQSVEALPVQHLSTGQKRRLSLAKLFLIEKPLWILDEPLASLDVATQVLLQERINHHLKKGGIVIASSHQLFDQIKQPVHELKMTA